MIFLQIYKQWVAPFISSVESLTDALKLFVQFQQSAKLLSWKDLLAAHRALKSIKTAAAASEAAPSLPASPETLMAPSEPPLSLCSKPTTSQSSVLPSPVSLPSSSLQFTDEAVPLSPAQLLTPSSVSKTHTSSKFSAEIPTAAETSPLNLLCAETYTSNLANENVLGSGRAWSAENIKLIRRRRGIGLIKVKARSNSGTWSSLTSAEVQQQEQRQEKQQKQRVSRGCSEDDANAEEVNPTAADDSNNDRQLNTSSFSTRKKKNEEKFTATPRSPDKSVASPATSTFASPVQPKLVDRNCRSLNATPKTSKNFKQQQEQEQNVELGESVMSDDNVKNVNSNSGANKNAVNDPDQTDRLICIESNMSNSSLSLPLLKRRKVETPLGRLDSSSSSGGSNQQKSDEARGTELSDVPDYDGNLTPNRGRVHRLKGIGNMRLYKTCLGFVGESLLENRPRREN